MVYPDVVLPTMAVSQSDVQNLHFGRGGRMSHYTNPTAKGDLLEADACKAVIAELDRLCQKYQKKVSREQSAREQDLEKALGYANEDDIREDYGWGFITDKQYERYLDLFRNGAAALENHTATKAERILKILKRIAHEIYEEQREWEFSALSPSEQIAEMERAAQAQKEWKARMAELKKESGKLAAERNESCEM